MDTVGVAPYVKAAARDMKAFRDARQYRKIPIGYSAADVKALRVTTGDYLSCGNTADTIDIYGMNLYSWCGNSSVYTAGYDTLYEDFQHSNIPVLFSETGCNTVERDFSDVGTMLGTVFPATFSGAIVYEWEEEANDYGIVNYTRSDGKGYPTTLSDYNALKTVLANVSPVGTSISAYTPSNTPPACPTSNSDWPLKDGDSLPTIAGLNIATVTPAAIATNISISTDSASGSIASATSTGDGFIYQGSGSSGTSNGLSGAVVAGLVVGVVAIVAIAAGVGVCFIVRRRSAKKKSSTVLAEENAGSRKDDTSDSEKPELPGVPSTRVQVVPKSELEAGTSQGATSPDRTVGINDRSGGVAQELPNEPRNPVEMEGSSPVIQELETTNTTDQGPSTRR